MIALQGALITVDAAMSVKRITDQIVEKKGDYLVPIKGNQEFYLKELEDEFSTRDVKALSAVTHDKSHGREELREAKVLAVKKPSEKFLIQWRGARTIIQLTRTRIEKDKRYVIQKRDEKGKNYYELNEDEEKRSEQIVYYISSRILTADEVLMATRGHWSIESQLPGG